MSVGIEGYVRLSRDEEVKDRGVSMEEKLALRREILQEIAKHNRLELPLEAITTEVKSGATLDERPGLLAILERCRTGQTKVLVAFDIDRLTRDVSDLKRITRSLFAGEVTLLTQRGAYRFDANFDTTLLQIMAVLGETELRRYSFRRRASNDARTRKGELSCALAPYGYRWDSKSRKLSAVPGEIETVRDIFRMIRLRGCDWVAGELTSQNIPPPGLRRPDKPRMNSSERWTGGHIHSMVTNPVYAGYIAKRHTVDRDGGEIKLTRNQWLWSDHQGDWETVVSLEEWEAIQEERSNRTLAGSSRKSALSKLLYCSRGCLMHLTHIDYSCWCQRQGVEHTGCTVKVNAVHEALTEFMCSYIEALPQSAFKPKRRDTDAKTVQMKLYELKRKLREKEATLQDLLSRASFYINLSSVGVAGHAKMLQDLDSEIVALKSDIGSSEAEALAASQQFDASLLKGILSGGGVRKILESGDLDTFRQLARLIIRRVDCEPMQPGSHRTKNLLVSPSDGRAPVKVPLAYKRKKAS